MNKRFLTALLTGAIFMASASMFVACKDYDDDIKNLQAQIDKAALKTELETLKSSLESELTTVKARLTTAEAELAKKADKTEVEALAEKVTKLTERVATIETQIKAINDALDKKADKTELAALEAALTGKLENLEKVLTEKISAEEAARKEADTKMEAAYKAADANLQLQIDALKAADELLKAKDAELEQKIGENATAIEALKTRMTAAENNIKKIQDEIIPALEKKIAANADAISELQKQMQEAAEAIDDLEAEVDALNVLVVRLLNSIVLKPDFYWEGVEGIEVPAAYPYLFAESDEPYSFTYTVVTDPTLGNKEIKVTVQNPMGFVGTDGKIYVAETAATWEGTHAPALAKKHTKRADGDANEGDDEEDEYTYDGYYYTGDGAADWQSLVAADGEKLLPDGVDLARIELSDGAIAKYHVNPATADLSGTSLSFFENDAEVYTRGKGFIGATPKSVNALGEPNTFENGILSVPFTTDFENLALMFDNWSDLWNQAEMPEFDFGNVLADVLGMDSYDFASNGQPLPFIALQMTKNQENGDQRVVTSDYAVVVPAVYEIIALADNDPEEKIGGRSTEFDGEDYSYITENHLYESVGYDGCTDEPYIGGLGAINQMPTHSVVYNGTIDLKPFIETHFNYTSFVKYGKSTVDQVMSDELLAALGLSYKFTIINYTTGSEKTSQSAHIEQIANGVFAPRSVTADGQTITGKTATEEVVGREPLVRVDLVTKDGKIVRYGYIKLRIVADKANDLEVSIPLNEIYMNCGDSAKVTWSQMENIILAKLNNGAGMKKEDFEKNYYLDVANRNIDYMPHMNPAAGELDGTLYTPAYQNYFWARRYFKNDKGQYELVCLPEGETEASWIGDDDHSVSKRMQYVDDYTTDANWFGRVWYTPHDNSTDAHNWDENTNVLVWHFGGVKHASNLTRDEQWARLRTLVDATYESKGLNQKALSTVVRFVNKNNGTSIWVTLVLDVNKIHFATADITNRVLDHWYDFKEGYKDGTPDTIEVYANVPTPAEVGQQPLTTGDFKKDLREYWLKKKVIPSLYDAEHFDQYFTADGEFDGTITFQFRLPKVGENTVDIDAADDGTWEVEGISGLTYTLYLNDEKNEIWAEKNDYMTADQLICKLNKETGVIEYMGRDLPTGEIYGEGVIAPYTDEPADDKVNSAASDILNLIGMFDNTGNKQKDVYLTGHAARTFAAYVEIKVSSNKCVAPLMGKNFFNVRFLRPINVWPSKKEITDAPNAVQWIAIANLVNIKDWRGYSVETPGSYAEQKVPFKFYGITNLYVKRNEIRSDAYREPAARTILTDPTEIEKLYSIKDIPSLTNEDADGGELRYLSIQKEKGGNTWAVTNANKGLDASNAVSNYLAYTNNGGVVKEFHIYVPIAVEYNWGALHGVLPEWTQTVWAVITVKPTVGNEAPAY